MREAVLVAEDAGELAERIAGLVRIGFDRVYLHHVGKDQDALPPARRSASCSRG